MVSLVRTYVSEQARGALVLSLSVGWADSGMDGLCIGRMTTATSNATRPFLAVS